MIEWNIVFVGWDRPIAGRESHAREHFEEFASYLGQMQSKSVISSFEPVILSLHGGDLNGFFLVRGERSALQDLIASEQWLQHVMRGQANLHRFGVVHGFGGESLTTLMRQWGEVMQQY